MLQTTKLVFWTLYRGSVVPDLKDLRKPKIDNPFVLVPEQQHYRVHYGPEFQQDVVNDCMVVTNGCLEVYTSE